MRRSGRSGAPRPASAHAAAATLRSDLEALGCSGYEAAVLMALMRLGSANALQLARLARVPRTSVYQVLESLSSGRTAPRCRCPMRT